MKERESRELRRAELPWLEPGISSAEKYRRRYRLDPEFNLKERIRRQITKRLKRDWIGDEMRRALKHGYSSNIVEDVLGYSIDALRSHLERQFLPGMGWHNMPEWHIDHITPQRLFDLTDDEQWRKCWCMSNLRPMWARDNIAKSGRVELLL